MLCSPFLHVSEDGGLIFFILIFVFHLSECSDWLLLFASGLHNVSVLSHL